MEANDLPRRAAEAGDTLTAALRALPAVETVRGAGLLIAAELAPGRDAAAVARACLDHGLILNAVTPTALRLAPPLLVTDDEIRDAVTILATALDEAATP